MQALNFSHLLRTLTLALFVFAPGIVSADAASDAHAAAAAPSAASTARAAAKAYLALWSGDASAYEVSPFTDDLVLRYSHSNPELRAEVHGRNSAVTQIRAVARLGRQWQFRELRLYPTLHDNVYFVSYTATGMSAAGGATVEQNVVLALELDGRQVVRLVEFANPAIALASREAASLSTSH